MLDAILSPDWGDRYYSFNAAWSAGEQLASMRNGSGNDWFIVFTDTGTYGRAFDHEAPGAPTLFTPVPTIFTPFTTEPAFSDHNGSPIATAIFWREPTDPTWGISATNNGNPDLFELLIEGTPEAYTTWAEDYYDTQISPTAVQHAYALKPLTTEIIALLNPETTLPDLAADITEIDYPR